MSSDGLRGNPKTTVSQAKSALEAILGAGFLDDWKGERVDITGGDNNFLVDVEFSKPGDRVITLSQCWLSDSGALNQYGSNYGKLVM